MEATGPIHKPAEVNNTIIVFAKQTKPVTHIPENDDDDYEYFFSNDPQSVIDGIGRTEYNFAKGAITGPILLAIAPVACAIDFAHGHETHLQATGGCISGFLKGIVRGVVGCNALVIAGAIHGANQFHKGILAEDAPGQGHGVKENVEHILNEPFLHLITNTESVTFKDDVAKLGEKGSKAKYQFFLTDEPKDFITGFLKGQYNFLKGVIAGATLAVCAPFKDSYDGYINANGWSGGVRGLGSGIARGLIGGLAIGATGLVTGIYQLLRGLASLDIPQAVKGFEAVHKDISKLVRTPIVDLIVRTRKNRTTEFIPTKERR